jgi:hypothetical protein
MKRAWLCALTLACTIQAPAAARTSSASCPPWPATLPEACEAALARYFAPRITQNIADDRRDFITRFDFDGNWDPEDQKANVRNIGYPLTGHVYYNVAGGKAHFFIGYGIYHPVDYKGWGAGHENDFEGALVVVERLATGGWGDLLAVETLAHDQIYQYRGRDDVEDREEGVDRELVLDEEHDGKGTLVGLHPELVIEAKGHGVYGFGSHTIAKRRAVYFPGVKAEVPSPPQTSTYALVRMASDELWKRRRGGALYREGFAHWSGKSYESDASQWLLGVMRGDSFFSMARPPWAWNDTNDGDVQRGDWMLAPAFAAGHHLRIPDLAHPSYYDSHPFLDGGSGTNPPFRARAIPRQATRPALRHGEVGFTIEGDRLLKFAGPGAVASRATPDTEALRVTGIEADSQPAMVAPSLEIALRRRTYVVLRLVNTSGAPAARVDFTHERDGALSRGSRVVLLPVVPKRSPLERPGPVISQARELLLDLDDPTGHVLRALSVTFTDRVVDPTDETAAGEDAMPASFRRQIGRFRELPRADRNLDLVSVTIVTTNERAGGDR